MRVFLSPVLTHRIRDGIPAGLVGAAASAGGVVGFGLRHGTAALPFEMAGRALAVLGSADLPRWALVAGGLVAHALWGTLAGVAFALAARPLAGWRYLGATAAFALGLFVLGGTFVPGVLGAGAYAVLAPAQAAVLVGLQVAACALALRWRRRP